MVLEFGWEEYIVNVFVDMQDNFKTSNYTPLIEPLLVDFLEFLLAIVIATFWLPLTCGFLLNLTHFLLITQ